MIFDITKNILNLVKIQKNSLNLENCEIPKKNSLFLKFTIHSCELSILCCITFSLIFFVQNSYTTYSYRLEKKPY